MRMKVYSNKGTCTYFDRNILDGCRYNIDELPLVDLATNLLWLNIQDLPYLILVLILLEFIIHLIESTCPSLFFPILDPLL